MRVTVRGVPSSDEFAARRATYRSLHDGGCFTLPNAWDVGSAIMMAEVLTLGMPDSDGAVVLIAPDFKVANGVKLF